MRRRSFVDRARGLLLAAAFGWGLQLPAGASERHRLIEPVQTDASLPAGEPPHLVRDDPAQPAEQLLLVWLPGTGGKAAEGPPAFFDTARQLGLRVLALSYLNTPAVGQVCVGRVLRAHPHCAEEMRQQRVWGDAPTALITDRAADAIVPRLRQLLRYLARDDVSGIWAQYLDGDEPRWERIVLAGQSQGGGMAAFIAQSRRVAGVLIFSGGWDQGSGGEIARWYGRPAQTPPERWHASYHLDEPKAETMERIYRRLGVPPAHIHRLSQAPAFGNPHTDAIRNPAYAPLWGQMLDLPR